MIRVLIVDDSRSARALVEMAIAGMEDYTVVKSLESAENAVVYCMSGKVDLVIMDVYTLGGESGLDAAKKIKSKYPKIKVVVITSLPEESFIRTAHDTGCDSFWYKDDANITLESVILRTMSGERVFPMRSPVVQIGYAKSTDFTPKEIEVLRNLARFNNYRELAAYLGITERTVRYHVTNLLEKSGHSTPMQLAFDVAQKGFIVSFKDDEV